MFGCMKKMNLVFINIDSFNTIILMFIDWRLDSREDVILVTTLKKIIILNFFPISFMKITKPFKS